MWKLGTEWTNKKLKLVYLNFVSIAQDVGKRHYIFSTKVNSFTSSYRETGTENKQQYIYISPHGSESYPYY